MIFLVLISLIFSKTRCLTSQKNCMVEWGTQTWVSDYIFYIMLYIIVIFYIYSIHYILYIILFYINIIMLYIIQYDYIMFIAYTYILYICYIYIYTHIYYRGWDSRMASLTQWTWVWASSERWWRTGKPGVLHPWGWAWLSDWTTLSL